MNVPTQFHRYLDLGYEFKISDCFPTIEIEGNSKTWSRVPKFYQGKSHALDKAISYQFTLSLFVKIIYKKVSDCEFYIIPKERFPKLFLAGKQFDEARLSGTRFPKYMTLFKAYETLTTPKERDIIFSSTRHSISHTTTQLTRSNVINTLKELYDGLEIDLSKFKHRKSFYKVFWSLLIETDRLLYSKIQQASKEFKLLYPNLKLLK